MYLHGHLAICHLATMRGLSTGNPAWIYPSLTGKVGRTWVGVWVMHGCSDGGWLEKISSLASPKKREFSCENATWRGKQLLRQIPAIKVSTSFRLRAAPKSWSKYTTPNAGGNIQQHYFPPSGNQFKTGLFFVPTKKSFDLQNVLHPINITLGTV